MSKLIICRGLPGSGKTTAAVAWVAKNPAHRARLNRDDFRKMLHDSFWTGVNDCEQQVTVARDASLKALLKRGVDVICDDTNLPRRTVRDLAELALKAGATFEIWEFTDLDVEECIRRDAARDRSVGEEVIRDKHERYLKGKGKGKIDAASVSLQVVERGEAYVADKHRPSAVVVDIDGTVALKGNRSPFDETRVSEDAPNHHVIEAVRAMYNRGHQVVFLSGRTAGCKKETEKWLAHNMRIPFTGPFMRKIGDTRKDSIVKRELFDAHVRGSYNVIGIFDDRQQVVDMWREMGLTVFQVAPGDF